MNPDEREKLFKTIINILSLWGGLGREVLEPQRVLSLAGLEDTPRNRRYTRRLIEAVIQKLEADHETERQASIAFYRSVILNPNAKIRDKIEARKRLDELLSIGPVTITRTQQYITISEEQLRKLSEILHDHTK
ncbi:MAG: hypothetical protein QXP51_05495 [Candidatus Hadarchaeales archaeon]